jgi:hypothetical protein
VLRKAMRKRAKDRHPRVRILSTEFGLIADGTPIPWYDRRMNPARAADLQPQVQAALRAELTPDIDTVFIALSRAYPHHTAGDILAEALQIRDDLDSEENAEYDQLLAAGELAAHGGRPACAVGGLAVARYTRASETWYRQLLADLEHVAGSLVDVSECRLHLLGIGRPDWVNHPLVQSFDSSAPARLASLGGWDAVRRYYDPDFGLSLAKLRKSREARLALFLLHYKQIAGQLWQPVDETLLRDDGAQPVQNPAQLRLAA